MRSPSRLALVSSLSLGLLAAAPGSPARGQGGRAADWLGEEMPLPLAVKTPADLQVKAVAERQYLIFNLLASGKLAWDRGDAATAARKWEALLQVPGLDPEIDRTIRPLAAQARARAGGAPAPLPAPSPSPPSSAAPAQAPGAPAPADPRRSTLVSVAGTVSGGGALGPGGTVLWLRRTDGPTPRPAPLRGRIINQRNKTFVPRVLPVTVGSRVEFKNQDDIFHNVFSLDRPHDFDAGLYKGGQSYGRTFDAPGPARILCNIHASMQAWVVAVDSPYFGQADASGAFVIKGVPPGEYELEAWHESAARTARSKLSVGADGVRGLAVAVGGDRRPSATVPDKYGKPRQAQLGY